MKTAAKIVMDDKGVDQEIFHLEITKADAMMHKDLG